MILPPLHHDITVNPSERRRQHWVPKAYLRQWCDPASPQSAYVWVCPTDMSAPPRLQSPKAIFVAADMNTMTRDGLRNLRLESIYHATEAIFGAALGNVISGVQLVDSDIEAVVLFTAAQMVRTPKFRDQWKFSPDREIEEKVNRILDRHVKLIFQETLLNFMNNKYQALSLLTLPAVFEELSKMRVRFLKSSDSRAFITCDAPCGVVEYKDIAHSAISCLRSPSVNVLIPLSPEVVAIFDHSDEPHEMTQILPEHPIISQVNAMIWAGSVDRIILPTDRVEAKWFEGTTQRKIARYTVK